MRIARWLFVLGAIGSLGATRHTDNFTVHASSETVAKNAADAAEEYRRALADQWLGEELPQWSSRCIVTIDERSLEPSGFTSFIMVKDRIARLRIQARGPLEDVLTGVLPHEITHAIFATHYGHSLPRWADEGAAILSEGEQQQSRQRLLSADLLSSRRTIALPQLIGMKEYPTNDNRMAAIYLQGFSLVDFLVHEKDRHTFVAFLKAGLAGDWDEAAQEAYGFDTVDVLERRWKKWAARENEALPAKPKKRRWV